ncbi:MAG TPA: aliphatic sulfonate ABC transporter substrate-binding protein [Streptosporangiaceae bacterium]|jgi:sulfonate transport system substrate-binding protein
MGNVHIARRGRPLGRGVASRRLGAAAVAAGLLLAGGATACSSSGGSTSAGASPGSVASGNVTNVSDVTLNVGDQAGAGSQALLTAAGLLSKLPFKVKWSDFTSGPPMLQAMSAGSVDIGSVGDAPPIFAAAGGAKIAAVGATESDPDAEAILVAKNSPIKTVAELKGQTIAVSQGSAAHYHLLATLKQAGLTIKDVKPDYLQPADAEAAFAAGHVAAWDVWSPYIEAAEHQYNARVLVNGQTSGTVYSFVIASRAALGDAAKAAAIRDYLKVLEQADAWAKANPSKWSATWAKAFGLPGAVTSQAVKDDVATPVAIDSSVISSEQNVANAFTSAGLIPSHVDFNDYVVQTYNSLVGSAG